MKKDYQKLSIDLHRKKRGKIELVSKFPLRNKDDLSIAYTPGIAGPSLAIAKDKRLISELTSKSNSVAVISDGSAVLGLGNVGPEAALPVMEGKAILFKKFAGIDAYPICLATQDIEEIIKTIKNISVGFGGINLEDISAPRCFEIEERLKKELNIPVMHDDQHGTAIVVLAGLINALKVVRKNKTKVKIVINGAGAAAIAIANLLMLYGFTTGNIVMLDSHGAIYKGRKDLNIYKTKIANKTNSKKINGGLEESLIGADIFIGVSVANILKPEWIKTMVNGPIVIAMANPNPEISFEKAKKAKIAIFGTGRSDYPNQINNSLVFPGLFRGALDAKARKITDEMKLAAAIALAKVVKKPTRNKIIPGPFDTGVVAAVSNAVKKIARH